MKKTPVCYDLKDIDLEDETNNILLNMSGGLLPEHLTSDEIKLLEQRFGGDWFHELGYEEKDGYKNPEIDLIVRITKEKQLFEGSCDDWYWFSSSAIDELIAEVNRLRLLIK